MKISWRSWLRSLEDYLRFGDYVMYKSSYVITCCIDALYQYIPKMHGIAHIYICSVLYLFIFYLFIQAGQPDTGTVARMVLNDWQRGKLPYYVKPPSK